MRVFITKKRKSPAGKIKDKTNNNNTQNTEERGDRERRRDRRTEDRRRREEDETREGRGDEGEYEGNYSGRDKTLKFKLLLVLVRK